MVFRLVINWEKSALMPVATLGNQIPLGTPQLKVVAMLKYLDIWIMSDTNQYINNNLMPLLIKFKQKFDIWSRLPLSVAERCNLIKMIWLLQLLYVLHNSPVWIGQKWFKK